jgi:GNAT superfamily N-acetyltransferase
MYNTKIRIRKAQPVDAQEIGEMAKEFADYLRALGDKTRFKFNARTFLRDGFGNHPAFEGLVTEVNGEPAGYLLYHWGYDTDKAIRIIHIVDLFVREEFRRHGAGQALIERVQAICKAGGGQVLVWEVHALNRLARKFYRHLGARYIKNLLMMKLQVK